MPKGQRRRRVYRKRKRTFVPYAKRGYLRTGGFYSSAKDMADGKELKFSDEFNNFGNGNVIVTGNIVSNSLVNEITQGTGPSERIGRKIMVKSLYIQFTMLMNSISTANDASDVIRFIVYWDKQTNGAPATVPDILANIGVPFQVRIQSFRDLENVNRFVTLMDKTVEMNPTASVVAGSLITIKDFRWYKKCNIPIEYSGPDNAIVNIRSNNIGILAITQNGNTRVEIGSRVRYTG